MKSPPLHQNRQSCPVMVEDRLHPNSHAEFKSLANVATISPTVRSSRCLLKTRSWLSLFSTDKLLRIFYQIARPTVLNNSFIFRRVRSRTWTQIGWIVPIKFVSTHSSKSSISTVDFNVFSSPNCFRRCCSQSELRPPSTVAALIYYLVIAVAVHE